MNTYIQIFWKEIMIGDFDYAIILGQIILVKENKGREMELW